MSEATYKCKDCGESFLWKDFGNDGYCKKCDPYTVDATHTDPIQIETAAVLKYRQRARVAEEALGRLEERSIVLYEALIEISRRKSAFSAKSSNTYANGFNDALDYCKEIANEATKPTKPTKDK